MATLDADQYFHAIKKLEHAAIKEKDKTKQAQTYYRLAQLCAGYKNPKKSYSNAYRYLLKSAESDPSIQTSHEFNNLLAVLTDMQALIEENNGYRQGIERQTAAVEQLETQAAACRKRNKRITDDNLRLIRENVDLKLAIERLKALDIEIERKRKNLR